MQEQMEERSQTIQNLTPAVKINSVNAKLRDFELKDGKYINKHYPKYSFDNLELA